jgi:hypothetical protein
LILPIVHTIADFKIRDVGFPGDTYASRFQGRSRVDLRPYVQPEKYVRSSRILRARYTTAKTNIGGVGNGGRTYARAWDGPDARV